MRHFLLAVHTDQAPREPMSDEDMRRGYELVAALEAEMRAVDALVYSGRLDGPEEARVVRPAGRRTSATDGPYAETKEQLGGFYVIAAEDRNAALEWASRVALAIDTPIEVRPFFAHADWSPSAEPARSPAVRQPSR
jgi:hypothetical protein